MPHARPILSLTDAYRTIARLIARSYATATPIDARERDALAAALRRIARLQDSQTTALAIERLTSGSGGCDLDDPTGRALAYRYALAQLRLGDDAAAKATLRALCGRAEPDPAAARLLAFVLKDEDPSDSLACLDRLEARTRRSPGLAVLYAECLIAAGRAEEARAAFQDDRRPPLTGNVALCDVNLADAPADKLAALNALMAFQETSTVRIEGSAFRIDALRPAERRDVAGPLVTVVMTTYDSAAYVQSSLASIVDQDYRELDVVVVDDFSADGTIAAVRQVDMKGRALTVVSQPCNMGAYAARNCGLAAARGTYVTFHDSDDWAHPSRVAIGVAACRAAGAVASTSQWARLDEAGTFLMKDPGAYIHRNHSSLTFDRFAVLGRVGVYQEVRASADSEFLQRIETAFGDGAVRRDNRMLAIGRARGDSLTRGGATKFSAFGASAVRSIYAGRWIDRHIRAELEGAGADWIAVGADPIAADLMSLAPQPGADAGADVTAADAFGRLETFWRDDGLKARFRAERRARRGSGAAEARVTER